jgi:hypothetical protein
MSLEAFANKKGWDNCHSVEFIPEMVGKRRMIWFLEAQVKAAEAHAGLKQDRVVVAAPAPAKPIQGGAPTTVPQAAYRRVRAVPIDALPDVYELYGEDGLPISRASVQQFSLSMKLRAAAEKGDVWVQATWSTEFGGYVIVDNL